MAMALQEFIGHKWILRSGQTLAYAMKPKLSSHVEKCNLIWSSE